MKKEKAEGKVLFDRFYENIWKERWESLKKSMEGKNGKVSLSPLLSQPYFMDEASILVSSLLPGGENLEILDMCASPGGKTLSIALTMKNASIVANDRSPDRVRRLKESIMLLPGDIRERMVVTRRDASKWCLYEKERYDRILLDAPCSSERHVLNDEKHLSIWSPSRPKRLSVEQYALLSSAFLTVKNGGYILYSTCSVNPGENEGVIAKLFKKHKDEVEEIKCTLPNSEEREYGLMLMPDKAGGIGPMYACLIRKRLNQNSSFC